MKRPAFSQSPEIHRESFSILPCLEQKIADHVIDLRQRLEADVPKIVAFDIGALHAELFFQGVLMERLCAEEIRRDVRRVGLFVEKHVGHQDEIGMHRAAQPIFIILRTSEIERKSTRLNSSH